MSESTAWGIGLLLAMFGPLLFVPIVWAIERWLLRRALGAWSERRFGRRARFGRLAIAAVAVGAIVLATYLPGRVEFARLCEQHAQPVISKTVDVAGFYRTAMFPYEAERFLREWKFAYVEAPDMYRNGRILRYAIDAGGKTVATEVPAISSRYAASDTMQVLDRSLTLTQKRVFERESGRELARAGSVIYHGGPLGVVLGVYGMSHCPDPGSDVGGRQFDDYYYLERKVLRASVGTR